MLVIFSFECRSPVGRCRLYHLPHISATITLPLLLLRIMSKDIDSLLSKLAGTRTEASLFNPYNEVCKTTDISTAPGLRQGNLRLFLESHLNLKTDLLWIFDTPDYHNAKLSGIPLVNSSLYSRVEDLLGMTEHFENAGKAHNVNENSKIEENLWNSFAKSSTHPLVWNVMPFYPYKGEDMTSKRKATKEEVIKYGEFLRSIISIFKPKKVVAVGREAKAAVDLLEIEAVYITQADALDSKQRRT